MGNVIEFSKAPVRNPLIQTTRYRCPHCGLGRTLEHGPAIVAPVQMCDGPNGCGAELSPIDENGRMEAR